MVITVNGKFVEYLNFQEALKALQSTFTYKTRKQKTKQKLREINELSHSTTTVPANKKTTDCVKILDVPENVSCVCECVCVRGVNNDLCVTGDR